MTEPTIKSATIVRDYKDVCESCGQLVEEAFEVELDDEGEEDTLFWCPLCAADEGIHIEEGEDEVEIGEAPVEEGTVPTTKGE